MNETKPAQWTERAAPYAALLFAIHLVTYLIAPIRALVLLPLWLWLGGRLLAREHEPELGQIEEGSQQATPLGQGKDR